MLQSIVEQRGNVTFPEHTFERVYMLPFFKKEGLPRSLERWQPTIDSMLDGVDTDDVIYVMIDQGIVTPDKTHRRGGMHIDGYWKPSLSAHNIPAWGYNPEGRWKQYGHSTHITASSEWPKEGIILASDVSACKALSGEYEDNIGIGGDCSHLNLSALTEHVLQANKVYAGNVTMLHESIPSKVECKRTLVRLNVPGWSPLIH